MISAPPRARSAEDAPERRRSRPNIASRLPRIDLWVPLVAAVVAYFLRTHFIRDWVFAPFGTRFLGIDAWYHARLIDNLVANFPERLVVDPLRLYPRLAGVGVAPLFDYLVAIVALVLGGGSPSAELVETVAAYAPPVLGAAACAVLYALGTRLWGRCAGTVAALAAAVTGGPFLARSRLGFADHHAAEALFSLLALLALVWALPERPSGDPDPEPSPPEPFPAARGAGYEVCPAPGPAAWSPLRAGVAGIALAAYMLSWVGGFILPLVLVTWAGVHFVLESRRGASAAAFARSVGTAAGVALALVFLLQQPLGTRFWLQVVALASIPAVLVVLAALRALADRAGVRRGAYAAGTAAVMATTVAALVLARAPLVRPLLSGFARLRPGPVASTIGEVRPLLAVDGGTSLAPAWELYRLTFVFAVVALPLLGAVYLRHRRSGDLLLAAWGLATLLLVLGQNRFGYYFAPSAALLTGFVCGGLWRRCGRRRETAAGERRGETTAGAARAVLAAAVIAFVLLPLVGPALRTARSRSGPGDEWVRALRWMRAETPAPFGEGAYLEGPAAGHWSRLQRAARPIRTDGYGVMSWWDYGYWITRIARRAPTANPTQAGARRAARFYTDTDAVAAIEQLGAIGARYVIADVELPLLPRDRDGWPAGKLQPMTRWAGIEEASLFETFYQERRPGRLDPVLVFYPDYYRTMAVRLSLFGGRAVRSANGVWVISWEPVEIDGRGVKKIVRARRFRNEREALVQLVNLDAGNHHIVGLDPLRSCVTLPAVEGLQPVYETPSRSGWRGVVPAVRIFEVTTASGR